MTISMAVEAICNMIKELATMRQVSLQEQSETTVNKGIKNASKAIKSANKALDIAVKYQDKFERKDLKEFTKQKKIFDNNIGSK